MKVINSKLAAIGLAAFVFASCSDSNRSYFANMQKQAKEQRQKFNLIP